MLLSLIVFQSRQSYFSWSQTCFYLRDFDFFPLFFSSLLNSYSFLRFALYLIEYIYIYLSYFSPHNINFHDTFTATQNEIYLMYPFEYTGLSYLIGCLMSIGTKFFLAYSLCSQGKFLGSLDRTYTCTHTHTDTWVNV